MLPGAHEDFHKFVEAGDAADPDEYEDEDILPGASEEFFQFADEEALDRSRKTRGTSASIIEEARTSIDDDDPAILPGASEDYFQFPAGDEEQGQ